MPLTVAQLQTLKTAINAETDSTFVGYRNAGNTGQMASWFNEPSTFVVWKSNVTIRETGQAFNGAEWAAMTTANHTRLQTIAQYLMSYSPGDADIRAMFDDIWSGAGGAVTRPALLALWKRFAKRGEKVFATGTGSDASPGTLVFEGNIANQDVIDAIAQA